MGRSTTSQFWNFHMVIFSNYVELPKGGELDVAERLIKIWSDNLLALGVLFGPGPPVDSQVGL